jgi:hypothetical protein
VLAGAGHEDGAARARGGGIGSYFGIGSHSGVGGRLARRDVDRLDEPAIGRGDAMAGQSDVLPGWGRTFKFGGLGCSGGLVWNVQGQTHATVDLQVTRDPHSLCVKFGLMTLSKLDANSMHVVWRATSDPGNVAKGTLTRTASGG